MKKKLKDELDDILKNDLSPTVLNDEEDFIDGYAFNQLKTREKIFVLTYVQQEQKSATHAAKIAGYSDASAHVTGSDLLKRQHIIDAINDWIRINIQVKKDHADAFLKHIYFILDNCLLSDNPDMKIYLNALSLLLRYVGLGFEPETNSKTQIINFNYKDKNGVLEKFKKELNGK